MENKTPLFLDEFNNLEDPRSTRNQLHSISEILLVTLCAVICGCETWNDIEDYGRIKLDFLKTLLPFRNGAPSDDTLRRFFRAVNVDQFQELFRSWINSILTLMDQDNRGKTIAIDGKSSRGSTGNGSMLHMISAYSTELRLVLGQEKVEDKSNEIIAIPKLLEWLDLRGSTVTIDAMGCQYKIADQIKEKEGDYIFSLKGNQGTLHEDVKLYLNQEKNNLDIHKQLNKEHGRLEKRVCYVSTDVQWIEERHPKWKSVQSIIRVDSERTIKDKTTKETRYFVSSHCLNAKETLYRIRSHWAVENSLHWVLDVSFGEDQSKIREDNAPQAMAIIRHIALNLIQTFKNKNSTKRYSVKRLRKMAGWDNPMLIAIISQDR